MTDKDNGSGAPAPDDMPSGPCRSGSPRPHTATIEVCCPTLNRPDQLLRLRNSLPVDVIFTPSIEAAPRPLPAIVNELFERSTGDIVVMAADHLEFRPGCIDVIRDHFERHVPDLDGVLGLNICNLPHVENISEYCFVAVGRRFLERFSVGGSFQGVFCPQYHHFGADTEFGRFAERLGRFHYDERAAVSTWHPNAGNTSPDATHAASRSRRDFDAAMWHLRQARGLYWGETFETVASADAEAEAGKPAAVPAALKLASTTAFGRRHAEKIRQLARGRRRVLAWGMPSARDWLRSELSPSCQLVTRDAGGDGELHHLHDEAAQFDLIVIDGNATAASLAAARPLLAPAGTVVLHGSQRVCHDEGKRAYVCHGHIGPCSERPGEDLWWGGLSEEVGNPRGSGALPLLISYFTTGTEYEVVAQRLIESCRRVGLEHRVVGLEPRGSWEANCNLKSEFVLETWQETKRPVLWVDADAIVHREPNLLRGTSADFGIHRCLGWILASGTVYFNQTPAAGALLRRWVARCRAFPQVWDQVNLDLAWEDTVAVLPLETLWLPEPYCRIFDLQEGRSARHSVIEHFQASRQLKARVSSSPNLGNASESRASKSARLASRRREWQLSSTDSSTRATLPAQIADAVARHVSVPGRTLWLGGALEALPRELERRGHEVHALCPTPEELELSGVARGTVGPLTALPYPSAHFDLVVSFGQIELLTPPHIAAALAEVKRVSRGCAVLVVHTRPDAEDRWPDHPDRRPIWTSRFRAAGFAELPLPQLTGAVAGFVWSAAATGRGGGVGDMQDHPSECQGVTNSIVCSGPAVRGPGSAHVRQLAEALSEALGAPPHVPTPDAAWLEGLAREAEALAIRAATLSEDDALECHVRRLAPTLPARFAVYGAGRIGRLVARICAATGHPASAFIESSTAAETVDGLPVWLPARAREDAIRCVVLGTRASAAAMRACLDDAYAGCPEPLRIEVLPLTPAFSTQLPSVTRALDVVRRGRTLSEYLWLVRRADERMDAALPINADVRRLFHADRYAFAAQWAAGGRVLDCACGTGYGSRWLARQGGAAGVLGIDVDPEAIAYAARHHGGHGVSFRQGDAGALDDLPAAAFDLVASFETIEHVPDDQAMLATFARVLAPGGSCVVSTPNDWPVEASPYHVRSYDAAGFEQALRRWFGEVTLFAQVAPTEHERGGVLPWHGESSTEAECLVAVCRSPVAS